MPRQDEQQMVGSSRLVGKIIHNIESELEELKDVLSDNNIDFEEMSGQTRSQRGEARSQRRMNADGSPDRRFKENRGSTTGQGQVNDPEHDRRLKENRDQSAFAQTGRR